MKNNTKLSWNDPVSEKKIIDFLLLNKVIVGDSDTVPGLLTLATEEGHFKLDSIKGRSNKPYLLLVGDEQKLVQFVTKESVCSIKELISRFWPGPLTIILPARKNIDYPVCSKEGTIAVRIPAHNGLQKVLAHVPALFSTSANKAGELLPLTVDNIDPAIRNKADLVVYGKEQSNMPSSTIIDCTKRPYRIIREGAIKKSDLKQYGIAG